MTCDEVPETVWMTHSAFVRPTFKMVRGADGIWRTEPTQFTRPSSVVADPDKIPSLTRA